MSPLPLDALNNGVPPSQAAERLVGLKQAVEAATGHLSEEILNPVREVIKKAEGRLARSTDLTVVALAGATGSGKSSLFNALTQMDLAGVSVRRPTTSWTLACAWGSNGAAELLEWMDIPKEHRVMRSEGIDAGSGDAQLDGLILLDLPDHDSIEMSHQLEMARLVEYADLVIWVLDPQKYADAAIHERYVRPMSGHKDTTLVVLNQIDRIPFEMRRRALGDLQQVISAGGLDGVTVVGVSATRGDGVDALRQELANRVRLKDASRKRLAADFSDAAQTMAKAGGSKMLPGFSAEDRLELLEGVVLAAGVETISDSIRVSLRKSIARVTNWPPLRWLGRAFRGPLNKAANQSQLIQRSELNQSIRDFVQKASTDASQPWVEAISEASSDRRDQIADSIDSVLAKFGANFKIPVWAQLFSAVQLVVFFAALFAVGWWTAGQFMELPYFSYPKTLWGFDTELAAALVGLVTGLLLAVLGQVLARTAANKRSKNFSVGLDTELIAVVDQEIVAPVQAVLAGYEQYRSGLAIAMR